jgi:Na+/proline symporter
MTIAILLAAYTCILLLLSVFSAFHTRDDKSFMLANKGMPWFMVAAVVLSDVVGGAAVIGVGQTAYNSGVGAFSFNLAVCAGLVLLGVTVAALFRKLENTTICETMGVVFDRRVKDLTAIIFSIVYFIVTCLQLVAGGSILQELLGIPLKLGVAVTATVCTAIVLLGGLVGIGFVNALNTAFVYIGLGIGAFLSLGKVGGWEGLWAKLPVRFASPAALGGPQIAATIVTTVFTCFVAQAALMGLYGAKTPKDARIGSIVAGLLVLPIGIFATLIGLAARAHFGASIPQGLRALPAMATQFLPLASGILFVGLWAVIISPSTLCLLATTQVIIRDVLPMIPPRGRYSSLGRHRRLIVLLIGILASVASLAITRLLDVLLFTFTLRTGVSISLLLAFLFGHRYRRIASPAGVFWGMLLGLASTLLWVIVLKKPWGIHEFYPTIVVFLATLFIVSAASPRRELLARIR